MRKDASSAERLDRFTRESQEPGREPFRSGQEHENAAASPEEAASPEMEEPARRRHLSGWVFDQRGKPVPSLAVFAAARRVFAAASGSSAAGGGTRSARTAGDGSFFFAELIDGEYLVNTQDTELYEAASATIRAGVDSAVLTVDEKSGQLLRVYGAVESDRSAPLRGVRVEPIGQPDRTTFTDETGRYALALLSRGAGTQAIRFLKEGFRETRLSVAPDEAGGEVTLNATLERLGRMAAVTGSVTGDGSPVHLAGVQLYSAALARSYRASSDRSGRFVFPEVEVGDSYRLWVHPPARYRDHVQEDLAISAGGMDIPVALEALGDARLSGQMVDPDGRPLPGLTLWLITASGGAGPLQVTGNGQGRFVVSPLPEGEVALQTRAIPLLSVSGITLSAGSPSDVRIVLDVGSQSLGGHVLDTDGGPVPGARASLYWSHDWKGVRSRSRRDTACDAAGYFLFTQLGSGNHTLSVTDPAFRGATVEHRVGTDEPEIVVRVQRTSP